MQLAKSFTLVFGLALVTAACGDSKSSLNPTAPSALSPDSINLEADAAVAESGSMAKPDNGGNGNGNGNGGGGNGNGNGNGNGGGGNGNGNGNQPRTPTNTSPNPNAPVPPGKSKVEFEGLLQAVGGGSITVNGQVIAVTADTVIRHGNRTFELSDLNVGDRVHVRANRVAPPTAGGTSVVAETTLEATVILVQNPGDASDPGEGEDDGLVSVTAFDASAVEAVANPGVFRLTRTGTAAQLALPLTVTFTLTGTAVNGTDYGSLPLTATFLANQATVDVTVNPLADSTAEDAETVILTLTSVTPYELGSPITATVNITDSANPLVSVNAIDATANEAGDTGRFVLTRTGDLTSPLTVTIALSGTAVNGTDYDQVLTTVTFVAGAATANVFVIPVSDSVVDPSETVILDVVDGASYDLGAAATATVTISGT